MINRYLTFDWSMLSQTSWPSCMFMIPQWYIIYSTWDSKAVHCKDINTVVVGITSNIPFAKQIKQHKPINSLHFCFTRSKNRVPLRQFCSYDSASLCLGDSRWTLSFSLMAEVKGALVTALARFSELKVRQANTSIPLIPKPINTCCSQLETSQCHGK